MEGGYPTNGERRVWMAKSQQDAGGSVAALRSIGAKSCRGDRPSRWARREQGKASAGNMDEDVDMDKSVPARTVSVADDEDSAIEPCATRPRLVPRAAKGAPGTIRSVCVVGGGPSGLGCCRVLCEAGLDVTLIQESRGLGGKLCTKYVNGKDDPTLHFDMGVQLMKPAGPLKDVLGDAVAPWPAAGRFKAIKCEGNWEKWKIAGVSDIRTDGYCVGVPSMSSIGHHLAEQCKGLDIHVDRTAHVVGQRPSTRQWQVEWERGAPTGGQLRYRPELKDVPNEVGSGQFDAVVLAFEANKIVRGCKSGYKQTQPSATPFIQREARKAKTCQLWNLMVAFDVELPMPWDAANVEGHHAIAWVAVDSSKPQRARTPQCFMVFSTREWADWKKWTQREVERAFLDEFLWFLEEVLGQRPPKPSFVLSGRWGNSTEAVLTRDRPAGEFPLRATGFHHQPAEVVWDAASRMGATGDWTRGFSVSDAYAGGVELATALLAENDRVAGA